MSFYKKIDDSSYMTADDSVMAPEYELLSGDYDKYEYPVEGWYWFDTIEEMYEAFGIQPS